MYAMSVEAEGRIPLRLGKGHCADRPRRRPLARSFPGNRAGNLRQTAATLTGAGAKMMKKAAWKDRRAR
jgi:hypothetical protein